MKKSILSFLLFIFFAYSTLAQTRFITGIVRDAQNHAQIEGVTIAVYSKSNQKVLGGTSTNEKGSFKIKCTFKEKNIALRLSFIGYETIKIDSLAFINNNSDIGTVELTPLPIILNSVEIKAQKPMIEYHTDKQVINIDQVPGSESGSVSDALNNTGIVDVDPSTSKLSLRGNSNVKILIDGKPQEMADNLLSQMPASYIDKIEVITTPSAKDDPEGDAGIINIITKKETGQNYNGTFSMAGTSMDVGYGSLDLNYRKKSFNIFGSAITYLGRYTRLSSGNRTNYLSDILHSQTYDGNILTRGYMSSFKLGLDYDFDSLNSVSLTGNFNKTHGKMTNSNDYANYDINNYQTYLYNTIDDGKGDFNNYTFSTDYKRKFNSGGHEWSADVFISNMFNNTHDLLTTEYSYLPLNPALQLNDNDVHNKTLILNTDYVNPIESFGKIEAGYKFTLRDRRAALVNNNYSYLSGDYYDSLGLSNIFRYRENIHAVYLAYTNKISFIEYKLGLRDELTFTDGLQETTGEEFKTDYNSLFPSLGISYKISDLFQFSFNAGRKINRPQLDMINPFIKVNGPNNITIGNPRLAPTYMNSYELRFNPIVNIYYTDSKGRPSSISTNIQDSITVNTTINSTSNKTYGAELTIPIINDPKFPVKLPGWFSMFNVRISYNHLSENGGYLTEVYSINRDSWKFSGNCNLNIWWDITAIFFYNIALKTEDERYRTGATDNANLYFKKDFLDKKLTIGLILKDIFNDVHPVNETYGSNFYSYNRSETIRSRNIGITFRYNFNNFTNRHEKEIDDERDKSDALFKN
ncbi:MAG: TonB-dependent receptor [Ignavibacteriaceae bacterium]